jgi:hypothetical protein
MDCYKKMFKETKKWETQPKQQRGKWSSKQQENNKQNNANPTTREMNMIQVGCKEVFTPKK